MRLVVQSGVKMSQEQALLCYQWLEHISMYGNQAAANPAFAKSFLQVCVNNYIIMVIRFIIWINKEKA